LFGLCHSHFCGKFMLRTALLNGYDAGLQALCPSAAPTEEKRTAKQRDMGQTSEKAHGLFFLK
jgi:hypothetical protein